MTSFPSTDPGNGERDQPDVRVAQHLADWDRVEQEDRPCPDHESAELMSGVSISSNTMTRW